MSWEEEWKKDLRSILMELREEQFDTTLELLAKIPQSLKTDKFKSRDKMPQIICEHYSLLDSITAISDIMDQIPRNDERVQSLLRPHVEKMRKEREKEKQGQKRKREERDDVPTDVAPYQQRSSQPNMDRKTSSQLEMEAQKLIYPESPVYSIKEAKSAADKTEVTVEGTVTEINRVEKVKVKQKREKTKKQTFQLKDETDSIRICMWGDATEQCKGLSPGDVIKVSNMKTNKYYDNISLDSTGYTRIDKVQSVGTHNAKIQVMGIIKATKKETQLEAEFNQQVHTLVVASRLLAKAFGLDLKGDFKESLLKKMPLSADAEIQGQKITKITAVEEM